MGIVSAIEAVPHIPPNVAMALGQVEELEYSLYVTGKESKFSKYERKKKDGHSSHCKYMHTWSQIEHYSGILKTTYNSDQTLCSCNWQSVLFVMKTR